MTITANTKMTASVLMVAHSRAIEARSVKHRGEKRKFRFGRPAKDLSARKSNHADLVVESQMEVALPQPKRAFRIEEFAHRNSISRAQVYVELKAGRLNNFFVP